MAHQYTISALSSSARCPVLSHKHIVTYFPSCNQFNIDRDVPLITLLRFFRNGRPVLKLRLLGGGHSPYRYCFRSIAASCQSSMAAQSLLFCLQCNTHFEQGQGLLCIAIRSVRSISISFLFRKYHRRHSPLLSTVRLVTQ